MFNSCSKSQQVLYILTCDASIYRFDVDISTCIVSAASILSF